MGTDVAASHFVVQAAIVGPPSSYGWHHGSAGPNRPAVILVTA